ncbi:YfdQ family protein [Rahnella aceris]
MSQVLDASAIKEVRDMSLSNLLEERLSSADCPAVALPESVRIHSLENLQDGRFRFRGKMETASIQDFSRYCKDYAGEGVRSFINADNMAAVTVFNLGTLTAPGHADNIAVLKLKRTAPFQALLNINGDKNSQKDLAEWLEDWSEFLMAFTADGEVLDIKKAIGGVRKITIEASSSADHEDSDFGAKRSVMESVEAKSKEVMPAAFEFKCVPYEGLGERRFRLRYSVLTGGNAPVLVLRIVQLETAEELMATEFRELLETNLGSAWKTENILR